MLYRMIDTVPAHLMRGTYRQSYTEMVVLNGFAIALSGTAAAFLSAGNGGATVTCAILALLWAWLGYWMGQ